MVKQQLKNFYLFLIMDEKSEEVDEEIANERRLASGTCLTLFCSLFLGHPEFQDRERAEDFLSDAESADDTQLLGKLLNWTDQILDAFMPNGDDSDVATLNANTASQISDAIQPFTMAMDDPHFDGTDIVCCPWPFVKKVRVSFDSLLLEQGIIIADLPGTTDKVRSRVDNAKRYLQLCDVTIVVNNMARAIDHAAMHNHINESYRRKRSGNTIVVGTCSDDFQVTSKQSFPPTPTEEQAMAEISEKETNLKKCLQKVTTSLGVPHVKKQPLERFKLTRKKEKLLREKNELNRKRVTRLKRKEELNRTFHRSRNSLKATIDEVADSFTDNTFSLVYRLIDKRELVRINQARRKCEKWAKLKPAGYTAVLRHNDNDLSPIFDEIHDEGCEQFTSSIAEIVNETIDNLNNALKVDPAAALSGAIVAFRANLKERKNQINKICEDLLKSLKKKIRVLQVRATTDDDEHYFKEAMKAIYAAAMSAERIRGKRVHDVRADTLLRKVTMHEGPFRDIANGIRKDYDSIFQETVEKLWNDINEVFERTRYDVNREDDSPEAKRMREDLLAMLPEARDRLKTEVWVELAKCKQGGLVSEIEE
ncbi:hypothetical protein G6514_003164 [Epicoccum nigrum]|nr:hypothetical protein G6514_003164 [Epicoccum nigrum]